MDRNIPLLQARDVDLRVQQCKSKTDSKTKAKKYYTILLAYKDARVDMRILDEVFGWNNWERKHEIIDGQLFCTVSVFDESKGSWISKQDVGVESNTEAEKGRASDSFKRACFNLGIGRELYDAPFLYIELDENEVNEYNGKVSCSTKFRVKEMEYNAETHAFDVFTVVDHKGKVRFELKPTGKKIKTPPPPPKEETTAEDVEETKEMLEELFGGKVDNIPYVRKNPKGETEIRSRKNMEQWFILKTITSINMLNEILNEKLYKECHAEVANMMVELSKK